VSASVAEQDWLWDDVELTDAVVFPAVREIVPVLGLVSMDLAPELGHECGRSSSHRPHSFLICAL